jgi:acyl-CoA thioester hydrolase
MESQLTYRGVVYPWQCDHNGHMNVMWYVAKFDEANWNFIARVGLLTPADSREQGRGFAALQQNIAYKHEVFAGELIETCSRLFEVREKIICFVHEMRNAQTGELLATCDMTAIHMDRIARKSIPIPVDSREAALQHIAPRVSATQ